MLTNNGTVMQKFNSDDMAHKIPRCIEWVTSIHTLLPGDILATGTNHRGLNPFMDGDKIELTCEGLGTLHIKVKDQHKRTWARITRLKHKESGAQGVHTPQTGGKYMPSRTSAAGAKTLRDARPCAGHDSLIGWRRRRASPARRPASRFRRRESG